MVHWYELLFIHHVQYTKATDSYIKCSPNGSAHEYLMNSKFHTIMHNEYANCQTVTTDHGHDLVLCLITSYLELTAVWTAIYPQHRWGSETLSICYRRKLELVISVDRFLVIKFKFKLKTALLNRISYKWYISLQLIKQRIEIIYRKILT